MREWLGRTLLRPSGIAIPRGPGMESLPAGNCPDSHSPPVFNSRTHGPLLGRRPAEGGPGEAPFTSRVRASPESRGLWG